MIAGNADSTVTPQSRGASHVALTPVLGRALAAPDAVRSSHQPVFETIAKNADTCKHTMLLLPLSTLPLLCGLRAAHLPSLLGRRHALYMNAFAKSFALRCALNFFTIFSRQACALYALAVATRGSTRARAFWDVFSCGAWVRSSSCR